MGRHKIERTICAGCHEACGMLVYIQDGTVVKVEGDPEFPKNEGSLCPKGLAMTQHLYHPDRLKHPLKRVGQRGEGRWEQIDWDEALDFVAGKFKEIREKYGPETITWSWGDMAYKCSKVTKQTLLRAIGSPNRFHNDAHYCFHPMMIVNNLTFGAPITSETGPDYVNSKCIMLWGGNPVMSHPTRARDIMIGKRKGAKLIVIDPRFSEIAAKADLFLQVRPATDDALALGMLNVIISEELYDKDFVENWTVGFDKLKERVQEYPVNRVSKITWVPEEDIKEAARMYALNKPASCHNRMGVQQVYNNSQTLRAIACLIAVTGNLDIKGGNIFPCPPPGFKSLPKLLAEIRVPNEEKALGADKYPLLTGPNSQAMHPNHPPSVIHAILTGEPYPIKAVWALNNLALALEDTEETIKAIMKLELFVGSDYFMTPTLELCDVILPPATFFEREENEHLFYHNYIAARKKVIEPVGNTRNERWMDFEIIKRMGLEMPHEFTNDEEYNNYAVKDMGITFADLKEKHIIEEPLRYKKYLKNGFNTPTGKVELYSTTFEKFGYDPLPYYSENPETPVSAPILAEAYPLILITGSRHVVYLHGANVQIPWLREIVPEPLLDIHPQTAEKYNLKEGDWAWVETPRGKGRAKFKVNLTKAVHPSVVHAPSHWFYPERGTDSSSIESNVNTLTCNDPPYDPISGAVPLRGLLCTVYKAKE